MQQSRLIINLGKTVFWLATVKFYPPFILFYSLFMLSLFFAAFRPFGPIAGSICYLKGMAILKPIKSGLDDIAPMILIF
jgi:hypothetical protein